MRAIIDKILTQAISSLQLSNDWPENFAFDLCFDDSRYLSTGFIATNLAFELSKHTKLPAIAWAGILQRRCIMSPEIISIEIASNGFLNFFFQKQYLSNIILIILNLNLPQGLPYSGKTSGLIQYAHARIKWVEQSLLTDQIQDLKNCDYKSLYKLEHLLEYKILLILDRIYYFVITNTITTIYKQNKLELIMNQIKDLANVLHSYYNAVNFMSEDIQLRYARLKLLQAVARVFEFMFSRE